jgi:hypothetical protein
MSASLPRLTYADVEKSRTIARAFLAVNENGRFVDVRQPGVVDLWH